MKLRPRKKAGIWILFMSLTVPWGFGGEVTIRKDLKKHFDEFQVEGSFVLYDLEQDHTIKFNPEKCRIGYIPASTFKIFHALVALETGILEITSSITDLL